jgi:heterodisulfide reductase subunit C
MHREQGPIWDYILDHTKEVYERLGGHIGELGEGPLRKISDDVKVELKNIFEVTGGTEMFNTIEKHSRAKAEEMGLEFKDEGIDNEYFKEVFKANNKKHTL